MTDERKDRGLSSVEGQQGMTAPDGWPKPEIDRKNQEASRPTTRMEHRQMRDQERRRKTEENTERVPKRIRVRLLPIWLRLIIIIVLCVVAAFGGAMIGYGVGGGQPTDVFHPGTWTHIRDIIFKK